MLFIHTIQQVQERTKTATRRVKFPFELWQQLRKHGWSVTREEWAAQTITAVQVWEGNAILQAHKITLPALPGRGKKRACDIHILAFEWDQDVREISAGDVRAEGFRERGEFFETWVAMHDPVIAHQFHAALEVNRNTPGLFDVWEMMHERMSTRPAALYMGWALEFELA